MGSGLHVHLFIYFECSSCGISWHLGTWQVNLRGGGEFGPDWERAGRFATGRLKAYEAGNTWTLRQSLEKNMFHSCWYCSYIWYVLGVFMSAPWFKVGLIGRFDYKPVQVISGWDVLWVFTICTHFRANFFVSGFGGCCRWAATSRTCRARTATCIAKAVVPCIAQGKIRTRRLISSFPTSSMIKQSLVDLWTWWQNCGRVCRTSGPHGPLKWWAACGKPDCSGHAVMQSLDVVGELLVLWRFSKWIVDEFCLPCQGAGKSPPFFRICGRGTKRDCEPISYNFSSEIVFDWR